MLGRAKNLIQAVLLITGKVLTSHFTLWRVTGEGGGKAWSCASICVVLCLWGFLLFCILLFFHLTQNLKACIAAVA